MKYLVITTVPDSHRRLVEGLVQMAESFLGTCGPVERRSLGAYERAGRRASSEHLSLVEFTAKGEAHGDAAMAKSLEGVLRSTLVAGGADGGEVKVFTSNGDAATDAKR